MSANQTFWAQFKPSFSNFWIFKPLGHIDFLKPFKPSKHLNPFKPLGDIWFKKKKLLNINSADRIGNGENILGLCLLTVITFKNYAMHGRSSLFLATVIDPTRDIPICTNPRASESSKTEPTRADALQAIQASISEGLGCTTSKFKAEALMWRQKLMISGFILGFILGFIWGAIFSFF